MTGDYVVVTCVSSYRMRYVMHKDDLQKLNPDQLCNPVEWAKDTVTCEECSEFSEEHVGEYVVDTATLNEQQVIDLFDKENDYLKKWSREKKINWVRTQITAPYSTG